MLSWPHKPGVYKIEERPFHVQFAAAQAQRYANYMKALEVARAANRDNPDILKALEQFKRKSLKHAAPKAPAAKV